MKPPTFVQSASAHKDSTPVGQFCSIKHQVWKIPTFAGLTFFSTAIALFGVGVQANPSLAQSRSDWGGAPSSRTGVVSTNSGIGLNIRSGPGLHFAIIGGAPDGAFLDLTGRPVSANCYTWRRLTSGGWVATDFVDKFGSGCAPRRDCDFGCGPIARPPVWQGGPYIVVVPPIGGNLPNQLRWVQQFVPSAFPDRALPGSFINAGSFSDYDAAQSQSFFLRSQGFDARVYFAYQNPWH